MLPRGLNGAGSSSFRIGIRPSKTVVAVVAHCKNRLNIETQYMKTCISERMCQVLCYRRCHRKDRDRTVPRRRGLGCAIGVARVARVTGWRLKRVSSEYPMYRRLSAIGCLLQASLSGM